MALDSHYGMNDVPLASLILLAWVGSAHIGRESWRYPWISLLTGLVLGLGFGIKYQAALGGLFPLVAAAGLLRSGNYRHAASSLAAVGVAGLIGVLWTSPMLREDPGYFISGFGEFMAWQANIMGEPLAWHAKLARNTSALLGLLTGRGHLLLLMLAGVGSVRAWRFEPAWRRPLGAAWLFSGVLLLAVLTGRDIVRINDLMPVWPLAMLSLGLGLAAGSRGVGQKDKGLLFLRITGFILLGWFAAGAWMDAAALQRPDTRERARMWCREHLQPGEHLVRERYTLRLEMDGVQETSVRYLASSEGRRLIEKGRADVLVASSLAYGRFFDKTMPYYNEASQQVYLSLTNHYDRAVVFADRDLPFAHPSVEIFRLRSAPGTP